MNKRFIPLYVIGGTAALVVLAGLVAFLASGPPDEQLTAQPSNEQPSNEHQATQAQSVGTERFGLTEAERKQFFREIPQIYEADLAEWDNRWKELRAKYGINEEQHKEIVKEADEKNWSMHNWGAAEKTVITGPLLTKYLQIEYGMDRQEVKRIMGSPGDPKARYGVDCLNWELEWQSIPMWVTVFFRDDKVYDKCQDASDEEHMKFLISSYDGRDWSNFTEERKLEVCDQLAWIYKKHNGRIYYNFIESFYGGADRRVGNTTHTDFNILRQRVVDLGEVASSMNLIE